MAHDDELLVSDGGTLKKMDVGLIATLAAGAGLTATDGVLAVDAYQISQITSVGALDGGTITSNFGLINNGSNTITTTGIVTGGNFYTGNGGTLKLMDAAGDNHTIIKAADETTADITYQWPAAAPGDNGYVLKATTAGVLSWAVDATSRPEAPPTPTSSSDRRFKKNISTVSGALEKLSKLNPVNYDWRNDEFKNKGFNDKKQWGFVAQEVEEVRPELVGTDEDDYLTLNYNGFVPLLTKAMQEQHTEIENQQKEIDKLKAQLEMIMKMMQSDMSDKTDNKKAENNQKPVKLSMATVK